MLEEIASHSTWKIIAARSPLFLKLFGRAGKKSTVTHLYLKCWKKSSAFHCRCHFLKQWTDINDYCLKKSTVIYPCPHCWLKIHCVHQTTIHRTDHYCRNPPLFPLLEKIQGYTLFISVAAKMPLLFIVKSMTGRNLSSSTNKSLWRKTRKELNSRPFLSLREQRKPSETKRVPFQVRSEAWSIKRSSFWSKCSKTWHHRFPPYIFLLFSCSLIIGWTECKRQYEQRGSMPVGAWWRSAAKCIVVNQQLHGSKSKQWVAMLEDIHHHTFFSWANTKISTVWETTNQFTIASTDEIEHCVCFFSCADFWMGCHLHRCIHKVPQYTMRPYILQQWCVDRIFLMGKSCWKNGCLTTLCGHGKWLFEKIGQVSEKQRICELESEPQIREAYLRKKRKKNWDCPIILGTGACLGHDYQIVFLLFFQWLEQRR